MLIEDPLKKTEKGDQKRREKQHSFVVKKWPFVTLNIEQLQYIKHLKSQ